MDIHYTPTRTPALDTHADELGAEALPGGLAEMHRVIESLIAATRCDWKRPLAVESELRF